ncbi:hypothetical protein IJ556_05300 [bacterium]|nr:hypothetical protein [bacterium]MBR2273692.1 hypothetical protein [Alphaproteobacteria bacterium]
MERYLLYYSDGSVDYNLRVNELPVAFRLIYKKDENDFWVRFPFSQQLMTYSDAQRMAHSAYVGSYRCDLLPVRYLWYFMHSLDFINPLLKALKQPMIEENVCVWALSSPRDLRKYGFYLQGKEPRFFFSEGCRRFALAIYGTSACLTTTMNAEKGKKKLPQGKLCYHDEDFETDKVNKFPLRFSPMQ